MTDQVRWTHFWPYLCFIDLFASQTHTNTLYVKTTVGVLLCVKVTAQRLKPRSLYIQIKGEVSTSFCTFEGIQRALTPAEL